MARIVYPETLQDWKETHDKIIARHNLDGAASPLNVFLTENGIDLAADNAAFGRAFQLHNSFEAERRKAEYHFAERNRLFDPALNMMQKSVQVLKSLNFNNTRMLGDWSFRVDREDAVVFPTTYINRQDLFLKFAAKLASYAPAPSPLNDFIANNGYNMASLTASAISSKTNHEAAETSSRTKEKYREMRDNDSGIPESNTINLMQFLKKFFVLNPKIVGDYGVTVETSSREPVSRKGKLKAGKHKTIKAAVIGSVFSNTGNALLQLQGGMKGEGEMFIVEPNQQIVLRKKFSAFVLTNLSNSADAAYQYEVYI